MTETTKPYLEVGRRITALRESKWLEPKDLADKLGVTSSSIYKYESGDRVPSRKTLEKMSDLFKVHSDYILYGQDTTIAGNPESKEKKKPKDLLKLLEQEEYTLNGELASPEDKERIKRIVEAMYWDAKEKNKRK